MHKIACFGDNCVDYYDNENLYYFGGNPLNVAVYTKRIGYDASYIGAIGTDFFGKEMYKAIIERGVDISNIHIVEGKSALTHVSIVDGDRIFGDYEENVVENFSLNDDDINFILTHDLAFTSLWGKCEKFLPLLKEKGIIIAFDSSDRPYDSIVVNYYKYIDIFFFSDDYSSDFELKNKMIELHNKGIKIVVSTRGEKGSLLYDGNSFISKGINKVEVVDTMGAGDSYIAGFLNAYLDHESLSNCMEKGTINSSTTLKYSGAW